MSLSHLFKAAKLSEDMLERRDFMKRIYGDRYAEKIRPVKELIQIVVKRSGKPILEAALAMVNQALADGQEGTVNAIIAAAVEMCEEGAAKKTEASR